jgi:hypothetical protein
MLKLRLFKNKHEAGIFVLFLLMSAFFWFLNALDNHYITEEKAIITVNNIDSGKIIINEIPPYILFKSEGSGFDLFSMALPFNLPVIQINLNETEYKQQKNGAKNYYVFKPALIEMLKKQINSSVKITDVLQDTLTIIVDELKTKKLPVKFMGEVSVDDNFVLENILLSPDSAEIIAPKSILDTLHFVSTKKIVLENLDESVTETIELVNPNENYCQLKPEEVRAEVKVAEYVPFELKVKITLPNHLQNIRLQQNYVTVKGLVSEDKLKNISSDSFFVVPDMKNAENPDEVKLVLKKFPDYAKKCIIFPDKILFNIER